MRSTFPLVLALVALAAGCAGPVEEDVGEDDGAVKTGGSMISKFEPGHYVSSNGPGALFIGSTAGAVSVSLQLGGLRDRQNLFDFADVPLSDRGTMVVERDDGTTLRFTRTGPRQVRVEGTMLATKVDATFTAQRDVYKGTSTDRAGRTVAVSRSDERGLALEISKDGTKVFGGTVAWSNAFVTEDIELAPGCSGYVGFLEPEKAYFKYRKQHAGCP